MYFVTIATEYLKTAFKHKHLSQCCIDNRNYFKLKLGEPDVLPDSVNIANLLLFYLDALPYTHSALQNKQSDCEHY